jgi:hypothetical protein
MLANNAIQVQDMLLQKLREANLSNVLRMDLSQFLDMEDFVFAEVVLSDGAELDRVEAIVGDLKDAVRACGTKVDCIVRALWEVTQVKDHGTAYGKDGAPRAAHEFYVTVKSGTQVHTVVVEISWGTMEAFRRKRDEEIVKIIRKFVGYQLRRGGTSYWDPLKYPRMELNDAAIAFMSAQQD